MYQNITTTTDAILVKVSETNHFHHKTGELHEEDIKMRLPSHGNVDPFKAQSILLESARLVFAKIAGRRDMTAGIKYAQSSND